MKEVIYDKSPIFIQNLLTTVYGYILKKRRYNTLYKKKISEFNSIDLKKTDFEMLQMSKLNDFLSYAKKNSPFYNEKLKAIKLPIQSLNELSKIPILSKGDIRENIKQIVTRPKEELSSSTTGGTTGTSLTVYYTNEDIQKRMAYLDYFKWKHGVELGMKRASFTGREIVPINQKQDHYWRYNSAIKQLLFSSYHANGDNLRYYIQKLNKFQPISLDGYPSIMIKIAEYSKRNNMPITFRPKAIFPTAETLLDEDKALLEEVFHTKVRNQYSSSEGAPFITECVEGSLHLNIETGVFEKKDDEDISEILVTSFSTHGTPLIRYEIGDSLEFTEEVCKCDNKTPIVKRILGRSSEFLYDVYKNVYVNSPALSIAVRQVDNIKSSQFYQEKADEIKVSVRLVDGNKEYKTINKLEMILRKLFSASIILDIQVVEEVKIDKSGKTRFIINELDKGELK